MIAMSDENIGFRLALRCLNCGEITERMTPTICVACGEEGWVEVKARLVYRVRRCLGLFIGGKYEYRDVAEHHHVE